MFYSKALFLGITIACAACSHGLKGPDSSTTSSEAVIGPAPVFHFEIDADLHTRFPADNQHIAVQYLDKVDVFNLQTGEKRKSLSLPQTTISMDTSTGENAPGLLLLSNGQTAQLWNSVNWQLLQTFNGSDDSRLRTLSPDGKLLSFDNALWRSLTAERVLTFDGHPTARADAYSADGSYFAQGSHHGNTIVVKIESGSPRISIGASGVNQLQFRRDNKLLVSYGAEILLDEGGYLPHSLGLYHPETGEQLHNYASPTRISCWALRKDGNIWLALTGGKLLKLDQQLNIAKTYPILENISACVVDRQQRLWIGSQKQGLFVFDEHTGSAQRVIAEHNTIFSLAFSPNENYLAVLTNLPGRQRLQVYDIRAYSGS